jgi:hypothetical protein
MQRKRARGSAAAAGHAGVLAASAGLLLATLSACGPVRVAPEPVLPHALIVPLPTRVALVIPKDLSNYVHRETRWGVDWKVELGAGHQRLLHDLFADTFQTVFETASLDEARRLTGIQAIFEPHIDQFSFTTSRETGRYYAVTIRYRIDAYTPAGERADTYTLTGYGNCLSDGITATKPLHVATVAAMRDAAAKFLVQFPELPAGRRLAQNQPLELEKVVDVGGIDVVPIDEPGKDAQAAHAAPSVETAPAAAPPSAPAPVSPPPVSSTLPR